MTVLPQFRSGIHYRADNLVVSRAPAEIAGKPITDLGLTRIGVLFQKRTCGDEKPRRADAALEGGVLKELALQGMQIAVGRHPFNGLDPPPLRLWAEHKAGAD